MSRIVRWPADGCQPSSGTNSTWMIWRRPWPSRTRPVHWPLVTGAGLPEMRQSVLHDRDSGLPVVLRPQQAVRNGARPAKRDAIYRRAADGEQDQPRADRADRERDRADRIDVP